VSRTCELSIIIPTRPARIGKLRRLLEGVGGTAGDRTALEVLIIVDEDDVAPLRVAGEVLPSDIRWRGFTQPHRGLAPAKNRAVREARGGWLLILDDDLIIDGGTIPGHLAAIRRDPSARRAFVGPVDWPPDRMTSPWQHLLARSPMIFFWNSMQAGQTYNFRHFIGGHTSVPAQLVRAAGGFDERFGGLMHEDIELGWRLEKRFGLRVEPLTHIHAWHDHPLSPRDYFAREHRAGVSAAAARQINRSFYEEVWGRIGPPERALDVLRGLFWLTAQQALELLERWCEPSPRRPSEAEIQAAYLAHLPLKRMMFCQGLLNRPFEDLWTALRLEPPGPETRLVRQRASRVARPAVSARA
jgi:glycosyltransferase involved in cell wall biosynthesis